MLPIARAINEHEETLNRQNIQFRRPRTWGEYISTLASLPAVRGAWGMGSVDSSGNVYDQTGQGRTLTYTGNPLFGQHKQIVPYLLLDGTGDYLTRASEAGLQVSGTSSYIATALRGLTLGIWFQSSVALTDQSLVSKWDTTGNQRAYQLRLTSGGLVEAAVSSDGTATKTVTSVAAPTINLPHFAVLRLTPSTELAVFLDGIKAVDTTSVPASIFATSTAAFQMGARNAGTTLLTGRLYASFLCANILTDDVIQYLYHYGNVLIQEV